MADSGESTFPAAALPRRAPFGDNPKVGAGGTRTQQRILRSALRVFGEAGYHDCGVDRITAEAECSRSSFYQYFSSKEDLFRTLSGELARRLFELTARSMTISSDADGWRNLRRLVAECGTVFDQYSPVFAVFSTAQAADSMVATGSNRVARRQVASLVGQLDRKGLRTREPALVITILLDGMWRAQRLRQTLVHSDSVELDRDRFEDALADVMHRALFGQRPGINVRAHVGIMSERADRQPPVWNAGSALRPSSPAARRTRARLLDAGRQVFVVKGYHETRVDDIVELADTSHGTFYRYFDSKDDLFRTLAARSGRVVVAAVERLASTVDAANAVPVATMRKWLGPYFDSYATEGPIVRAWIEATWADESLRKLSPLEVEAMRRRLARFLAPRRFGDIDADALVLMALLDRNLSLPTLDETAERDVIVAYANVVVSGVLIVP